MTKLCNYIVIAGYEGCTEMAISGLSMSVEHQGTEHETEALALVHASDTLEEFYTNCFPKGTPRPIIKGIELCSICFVPSYP